MTYRDLEKILAELSEEQKDQTVTVWDGSIDEYYTVTNSVVTTNSVDVLDENHFVLKF